MFKSAGFIRPVRTLVSSVRLLQVSNKSGDSHLQFLLKYYSPDLLQSIQITESLVSPQQLLEVQKKGLQGKSRAPPSSSENDYHLDDPQWTEPILYPNQAGGLSPYASIPLNHARDRKDLVIRFKESSRSEKKKNLFAEERAQMEQDLAAATGFSPQFIRKLYVRPVVMKRVSCQTSKGKIPNFYAMTIVGNQNGMIGLGEGKSRDGMRSALKKAHWQAVRNLTPITRYEDRTIVGDVAHRFHAVKMFLKSAPDGFGLRVNHNIFEVCQAAGIRDLRGKVYKLRNAMNVVKGFVQALTQQRSLEDMAVGRGKKIIDLRKVYYSA